jgi:hypothetical protein
MKKPQSAFEAHNLFMTDPLPQRTDRVNMRLWVVSTGAEIVPLTFNEVSKMYHPMEVTTGTSDWFVQEGLVHQIMAVETGWFDATTETPLFVEFTKAQQDRIGKNVRGFLCNATDLVFIGGSGTDIATAIPPIIQDYKHKAATLISMMRNDPSKELTFAFKKDSDGKQIHMSPENFSGMLNKAASLLGGFDKLVTLNTDGKEEVDWKTVVTVTNTVL